MIDVKQIQELRRLTNAGLAECKRALEDADGDLFSAATSLLTEDDVLKIQQSVRVRAMAGQSIKDPVSDDEQRLVDALVSHFVARRTRPLNVAFLFQIAELFHADNAFREAVMEDPASAVGNLWRTLNVDGGTQRLPMAETFESRQCLSTVVTMPVSQSEWECDFIVLQHPRRGYLLSAKVKVLAIYKRTKRDDRGLVNIEEMAIRRDEVVAIRRWVLEDANLETAELARAGFAPGLREVGVT
jgi:hypothetical protein